MTDHCQQEFGYDHSGSNDTIWQEKQFSLDDKAFPRFSLIEAVSADHEKCRHDPASEHTAGSGKESPASCRLRFQIQVHGMSQNDQDHSQSSGKIKVPKSQGPAYIGSTLIEFTLHPPHLLCPSVGTRR